MNWSREPRLVGSGQTSGPLNYIRQVLIATTCQLRSGPNFAAGSQLRSADLSSALSATREQRQPMKPLTSRWNPLKLAGNYLFAENIFFNARQSRVALRELARQWPKG